MEAVVAPTSHTPISTLQTSISVSVKTFGSALAAAPFFVALLALAAGLAFSSFAAAFDAAAFDALAAGAAFTSFTLAGALAALLALAAGAAALTGSSSRVRLPRVPAMIR